MHTTIAEGADARDARRNMAKAEQLGSIVAGTALTLFGVGQALGRRTGLGLLFTVGGALLVRRGYSGHCDVYQAAGVDYRHGRRWRRNGDTRRALAGDAGVRVQEAITVNRPAGDLYQFWRQLENLPRFMSHIEAVTRTSDTTSHWKVKGPGGTRFEWDAEIINEVPNELIAWKTTGHPRVVSAGSVHFEDAGAGRGTHVRVKLQYSPPLGKAGAAVSKLFGRDAATEIREDLRRFKQLLETGEIATIEGQPRGGR